MRPGNNQNTHHSLSEIRVFETVVKGLKLLFALSDIELQDVFRSLMTLAFPQ